MVNRIKICFAWLLIFLGAVGVIAPTFILKFSYGLTDKPVIPRLLGLLVIVAGIALNAALEDRTTIPKIRWRKV